MARRKKVTIMMQVGEFAPVPLERVHADVAQSIISLYERSDRNEVECDGYEVPKNGYPRYFVAE